MIRTLCLSLGLSLGLSSGLALIAPAPVAAQTDDTTTMAPAALDRMWAVLDMPGSLAIMREEGQDMAASVAQDYLPGTPGAGWRRTVDTIYDAGTMDRQMRDAFGQDFAGADPDPVVSFFDSALGQRIIALELSARRAFMDPDTEAAAEEHIASGAVDPDRLALIDDFIAVNDLLAYNMSGALNTNFAFLSGLAEAELFKMTEADILARVYENVESTQAETEVWLRAYLTMAYQPLSDDELRAYIDFSDLPEGRRLNRALFAGFGAMYDAQYHALGRAVADQLGAQEL